MKQSIPPDGINAAPTPISVGTRFIASAILAFSLLLTLFIVAESVLAHGGIARTNPPDGSELDTAPEVVQVWFDETIVRGTGSLTVINGAGARVDQGEVLYSDDNPSFMQIALQFDLANGAYIITASATVVSDGHTATGSSVFWIGKKQSAAALNQNQAAPAYEMMGLLLGAMLIVAALGYWLLFHHTPSLEIVPPAQDIQHFPLE